MKNSVSIVLLLIVTWLPLGLSADQRLILVVGDSLSAGYYMPLEQAWPSLLEKRLAGNGHSYRVVNASITGDTTQGGLTRLPRLLTLHEPDIVIIELGGNDGLRGIGIDVTRQNLSAMIEASQAAGASVLLTGIMLPPNYGQTYTERFQAIYPDLARQYELPLVPFLLEGVALDPALMLDDGIHPNAIAQPRLLDNVWAVLAPVLD
jgi:acyl-CoA thioesterase-1